MEVKLTKNAVKSLKKAPIQAQRKYRSWLKDLAELGLVKTRQIPGYHDKLLAGKKKSKINPTQQKMALKVYACKRRIRKLDYDSRGTST